MSSPDFPGPSWQDKSELFDEASRHRDGSGGYGNDGGYGNGEYGRAAAGGRAGGYANGANDAGYANGGSEGGHGRGEYGNGAAYGNGAGYGNGSHRGDDGRNGSRGGRENGNGVPDGRSASPYEPMEYAAGPGAGGRRGDYGGPGDYRGRSADRGSGLLTDDPDYVSPPDYGGGRGSGGPYYGEGPGRGRGFGRRGPVAPAGPYEPDDPDVPGGLTQVGRRLRAHGVTTGFVGRRQPAPGTLLERLWRGSWWRRWTLKKAALVTGGTAVGLVLILIAGFFYAYSSTAVPNAVLNEKLQTSSVVYYAGPHGKQVACFCTVNRTILSQAHVEQSKMLVNAVVAAEDRNFFHEGGVSLTGILRAAKNDIMGSGNLQGGSTITEELVKQYYDHSYLGNLTYSQKLDEVIVAIKLAQEKSKWWVMTHYLNTIYFGAGAWGAEAAAETYFGKHAWQLDAAQAAMIAAMIQSPSGFDPTQPNKVDPGIGTLYWRWKNEVLANMVRDGNISASTANSLKFPKVTIKSPAATWTGYTYYIMTMVQNELEAYYHMTPSEINSLGLQIHTTISQSLMKGLYQAVATGRRMIRQYGGGQPLPRWVHIGAVLEKPGGAIKAFYGGPGFGLKHCVGCDLNTVLSEQQVGSSFKPYVLTTAVSQGMNAKTSITNSHSPLCIPPADKGLTYQLQLSKRTLNGCQTGLGYYPLQQPGENFAQNLTVPAATALSSNPAYEDLIHRTSVYAVLKMARTLGVSPATYQGLWKYFGPNGTSPGSVTAALGQGALTVVDQANTFATLVSGGTAAVPHVISYITENGTKLPIPSVYGVTHPLQPYVAADADYALSFDTTMPGATGHNAYIPRPMIAKTGTLGSGAHASQAWFIGAIPQYSLAFALFTDKPGHQVLDGLPSIGGWGGSYGGAWPATLWHIFASQHFTNLQVKQLPTPNFNPPQFTKWVQAAPIVKKCSGPGGPGPFGPGGGNGGNGGGGNGGGGHGHGHARVPFVSFGKKKQSKCQNPGPSPSPSPSGGPSPSPTPSPSPSFSISPSPSFSPPLGAPTKAAAATTTSSRAPKPGRAPAVAIPSLTTMAVLVGPALRKPAWAVRITGLA